jgi:hypothetical protein
MVTIAPIIIGVIESLGKLNTFMGVNFFGRWRENKFDDFFPPEKP